jgi:5-(carboxyamino)imidazole ribonucleotide synthase
MIPPGGTIGILGGGQLGRMLAMAAGQLGYRVAIYAPEPSGPAADVSSGWTRGRYDDPAALAAFASRVDVLTYEFENVDHRPLSALSGLVQLSPSTDALRVSQDRAAEKRFAAELGIRTAPWRDVPDRNALDRAIDEIGMPAILKTRRFGYDGKGQARIEGSGEAHAAWDAIAQAPAILEGFVRFEAEFSILVARGEDGTTVTWDAPQNVHRDGILATSTVPAPPQITAQVPEATRTACRIADALGYVGVMACEFFAGDEGAVFNEMAPRVHNSGHWTIEGSVTSQFENHIRAICGLPLGSTALTGREVQMENLIGAEVDRWPVLLAEGGAHLHLYGKGDARPGRKMGHVTRVRR